MCSKRRFALISEVRSVGPSKIPYGQFLLKDATKVRTSNWIFGLFFMQDRPYNRYGAIKNNQTWQAQWFNVSRKRCNPTENSKTTYQSQLMLLTIRRWKRPQSIERTLNGVALQAALSNSKNLVCRFSFYTGDKPVFDSWVTDKVYSQKNSISFVWSLGTRFQAQASGLPALGQKRRRLMETMKILTSGTHTLLYIQFDKATRNCRKNSVFPAQTATPVTQPIHKEYINQPAV